MKHRRGPMGAAAAVAVCAGVFLVAPAASAAVTAVRPSPGRIDVSVLSSGARAWFGGPQSGADGPRAASPRIALGSNVDANSPQQDLAAGQSETVWGAITEPSP
jgi:hypothetical protein